MWYLQQVQYPQINQIDAEVRQSGRTHTHIHTYTRSFARMRLQSGARVVRAGKILNVCLEYI